MSSSKEGRSLSQQACHPAHSPARSSYASFGAEKPFTLRINDSYTRSCKWSVQQTPSPSKQVLDQQLSQQLENSQETCSKLRARVASLKQQLTVKTSESAALAEALSTLTLQLDSMSKSQTARVSATAAYQKLKSEAAAVLKQSKALEVSLEQAQQEHQDSQRTCSAQQQELVELQDKLQAERSAHLLTAQREEQAAAALAAEHQRLSSGAAALMSAHQGLQASHAEAGLLRAQLAEADSTAAELQETVAGLQEQLNCACQAAARVWVFALAVCYIAAQLAAHNSDLQQQLAGTVPAQQAPAAAASASSTVHPAAAHMYCADAPDVAQEEAAPTQAPVPSSTSSALLAVHQGLQDSAAGATPAQSGLGDTAVTPLQQQQHQHVATAAPAARKTPGPHSKAASQGSTTAAESQKQQQQTALPIDRRQQGLSHRKPPRCKLTRKQPNASTPLQQQLSRCQALLQKQSEAAALAAAKASAAEWRAAKLSAECGHLQQQHTADAGTISTLQKQLQQLQGQLLLLQDAAAGTDQLQTLLLPQHADVGSSHLSTASQHKSPQYVPPARDTASDLCQWPSAAAAAVHAEGPGQAAITALLQPEVSHRQDTDSCDLGPELTVLLKAAAPVQLSRQWGSGLCETRCGDEDDAGSSRSSSAGEAAFGSSTSSDSSGSSSEQGFQHPVQGGLVAAVSDQPGGLVSVRDSTDGGLQAVDDSKDSFYTAVEVLSDIEDE